MGERPLHDDLQLRVVLDTLPAAVLVVDAGLRIYDANRAAEALMDSSTDRVLGATSGDVLHCLNAARQERGCGHSDHCAQCVIRGSSSRAAKGKPTHRQLLTLLVEQEGRVRNATFLLTAAPLPTGERKLALLVLEDITELAELRKLLPMCSYCRKVRDDGEYWQDVEQYLTKNTAMAFSHGVCPDCLREHYPDEADQIIGPRDDDGDDGDG